MNNKHAASEYFANQALVTTAKDTFKHGAQFPKAKPHCSAPNNLNHAIVGFRRHKELRRKIINIFVEVVGTIVIAIVAFSPVIVAGCMGKW